MAKAQEWCAFRRRTAEASAGRGMEPVTKLSPDILCRARSFEISRLVITNPGSMSGSAILHEGLAYDY